MGNPPSPSSVTEPTPSPIGSNVHVLYYGAFVVGAASVLLALYNFVTLRWGSYFSNRQRAIRSGFHHLNEVGFGSSFEYKRDDGDNPECVVCLSAFEEGEELRKLPKCNHSFHAPCIDMWLYSHMDCPLCRCAVELPGVKRNPATVDQSNHSVSVMYF